MATYNFDLLDLADGESGDAAVSVVVGKKKKTEAATAKEADAVDPAQPAAQEKPKYSFYAKLQVDGPLRICEQEQQKLKDALWKLRGEEKKLRQQPGNEARLKEVSDEQKKLRLEKWKLEEKEWKTLRPARDAFYKEYGITLPGQETNDADPGSNHNSVNGNVYNNNDGGSSHYGGNNGENQTQMCDGGEHNPHGHDERQVERGHYHYNNDDRQGYPQGQPGMKVYVPKVMASSDAGTEAEEKPEENVVSATDTDQKEASADNADAVPASDSDKSAGGAAEEGPKKKTKTFIPKETFNGSEKRKKKNAKKSSGTEPEKEKKQGSEVDGSKPADKQPLEEEKKTLAEYEKMREEKKTSEVSKTVARKITAEEFKGLQMLEKKKLDDEEAVIKVEKAQPKVKVASKKEVQAQGKDAAAKDGKPKKVVSPHQILGFIRPPRRVTHVQEDGSYARAGFSAGFQGGSRDNSTEPRVNGRAAQNEAGGHNGNGAPRGAYSGRGDGAPRGDYSGQRNGHMGSCGYGYGRGHGVNQGSGGYQQQRQGGNVGQYQRERAGNGGYYPQRHQPGSNQQRGNSGDRPSFTRAPAPVPDVEDMSKFPALPAPASAKSAAPGSAPVLVPSQASAPAAAPAPAA